MKIVKEVQKEGACCMTISNFSELPKCQGAGKPNADKSRRW